MSVWFRTALSAALFATSAMAGAAGPTPPTSPEPALGDPMPSRLLPYPGGVTAVADVQYSSIDGFRPLILDLYLPPERSAPKPLLIYVHGGGWRGGHTRQSGAFSDFPGVLADLASRGYVVASVEYRLSGEARFPAALNDVRAAVRYLRANAGKYGIDSGHVGIFGGSAGGQLSILEAVTCGGAPAGEDKANADQSDCPQAAVGWYGIYNFPAMPGQAESRAEDDYIGCRMVACPKDKLEGASAIAHVDAKDPPILLLHGEQDKTVPVAQSRAMAARLQEVGASVDLEVIPGVGHSWIGANEAETRAASLHALDRTLAFFDSKLRPAKKTN
jgi:acetyl esterase/lipase